MTERRRSPLVLVALAALAVTGITACGGDDTTEVTAPGAGLEHVHGLGIDPGDGTLYAATHFGLFRIPENGEARRVGDSYQDTMGFTVVGAEHFLGSGHPDLQDVELPPLLGLIESTDGGRRWEPISLLGEADFHALVARHGLVYGYDATNERFMVSSDRRSWESRSSPPGLVSFAVDPTDADHILATTTAGLIASADGGRAWDAVAAPPLALVSWAADGKLAAVGPGGLVFVSNDGGASWAAVGELPGSPEAFLAIDGRAFVAAVTEKGLYRSRDGGVTWKLEYRDPAREV